MGNAVDAILVQQLGAAMSDLSERCYYAGWMGGSEDVIPELCRRALATGVPQHWGHGEVTPEIAQMLTTFAERAGAWADLHPQDDTYVPYQPRNPVPPEVAAALDRAQAQNSRRPGRAG
jgi:hypothetical protein